MTAAGSPWSNGLAERHNGVLGNTVRKMMSDKPNYSLETGVAWTIAAMNSLKNVYEFSPNQLVFGKKTNFPSVESNKLPALEGVTCSKIFAKNFSAMDEARLAFIKSEPDEKLRRALRHQVRRSSEVKYVTGDKLYYKRRTDDYWKGPATVIGQDNQQVLIKHGSTYQRMHLCRLRLIDCLNLSEMEQNPENKEEVNSYDSKEIVTVSYDSNEGFQDISNNK